MSTNSFSADHLSHGVGDVRRKHNACIGLKRAQRQQRAQPRLQGRSVNGFRVWVAFRDEEVCIC
jgi:hypothetical protein